MSEQEIIGKIQSAIPDAVVELRDLTGTKDHWQATILAASFDGMSRLARHRAVFGALAEELKGPIHALTLELYTPAEAAAR